MTDAATTTVLARRPWNPTGYQLVAGHTYRLTASGTWVDLVNCCGPDGYASTGWRTWMRPFERYRRAAGENWFVLMGVIDAHPRHMFRIGSSAQITAPVTGKLLCFANDVPWAYCNNWRSVELTIEHIGSDSQSAIG